MSEPRSIVFFGAGAFGLPTFERLCRDHRVRMVVTQPDRPAGRKRVMTPTPIGAAAAAAGIPVIKPDDVNVATVIDQIHDQSPDAMVVIAYGQKLSPALLENQFAINLHSSLLPLYRGAAPINWAVLNGDSETGVSVIALAQRMDAGVIYGQTRTAIDPLETAGELHDRLAELGPDLVEDVLVKAATNQLVALQQEDQQATRAPKLSRKDGVIDFSQSARMVQARVHGLTPWPGCSISGSFGSMKVCRVDVVRTEPSHPESGHMTNEGVIGCGDGAVQLLEVQPPGKRVMPFADFARGNELPWTQTVSSP